MIDGQNVFDPPVKNDMRTYDNIQKIVTGSFVNLFCFDIMLV